MGVCHAKREQDYKAPQAIQAAAHTSAALDIRSVSSHRSFSCGQDQTIKLFDWNEQRVLFSLEGHTNVVNKIVPANASVLWSCSRDLAIKRWDLDKQKCTLTLTGHTLNITAIAVSPDMRTVCSGARDTSVRLWDAESGAELSARSIPRNLVTCLSYAHTCNLVIQGSEDLTLRSWDTRTSRLNPDRTASGYTYFPLCMDISLDDTYVVTGSKGFNGVGCEITLWDLRKNQMVMQLAGHAQDVTGVKFVQDTDAAVSVSKDGTLAVWDLRKESRSAVLANPDSPLFTSVDIVSPHESETIAYAATYSGSLSQVKISRSDQGQGLLTHLQRSGRGEDDDAFIDSR